MNITRGRNRVPTNRQIKYSLTALMQMSSIIVFKQKLRIGSTHVSRQLVWGSLDLNLGNLRHLL